VPNTHCLPSGSLGSSEVPVCQVGSATITVQTPAGGIGHGTIRGIVAICSGLSIVPQSFPIPITDGAATKFQTLATALTGDGWVVAMLPFPEDAVTSGLAFSTSGNPAQYIQNDIVADTGHGSRMVAARLHWWDHVLQWIKLTYPAGFPVVCFGVSMGGWYTWNVAINRTSSVIAYGGHCGVTILSDVAAAATGSGLVLPTGANWTAINTTGADVGSSALNGLTSTPGWIGWSTLDTVVGDTDLIAMKNAAITAGCPITTLQDTTNGHGLWTTDIGPGGSGFTGTTIMDWFTATVDPLAPKTF
jgi:hypothetical protein